MAAVLLLDPTVPKLVPIRKHTALRYMWVPDLGLSLRVCPGIWRPVQGPIARPRGFLPAPYG
eukprot:3392855-Prymnesium_polylepis.1